MQDCSDSIADALELLQSCTKPLKWSGCLPPLGCWEVSWPTVQPFTAINDWLPVIISFVVVIFFLTKHIFFYCLSHNFSTVKCQGLLKSFHMEEKNLVIPHRLIIQENKSSSTRKVDRDGLINLHIQWNHVGCQPRTFQISNLYCKSIFLNKTTGI